MKKLLYFVLFGCVALSVNAAPVHKEAAKQKAAEFLRLQNPTMRRQLKAAKQELGLKSTDSDNAYYYVFNIGEENGFVIVSGDDRTESILGYTDAGSFSEQTLPDNLRAWLAGYADQLRQLEAVGSKAEVAAPKRAVREYIAPLLSTLWDQGAPFNLLCPSFITGDATCVAGCVATAMAQIMNYHQWPAKTIKVIPEYSCRTAWSVQDYPTPVHVSVDAIPAGESFNWGYMEDTYTSESSLEGMLAVAQLIQACGASVNMDYRTEEYGGSQAANALVSAALKDYFDYAATTRHIERENYLYDEWESIIYSELEQKRPILYGGLSSGGGHAFVVDGYKDNLFHVNWGWGGYCDGFFALTVMNPGSNAGIGASSSSDGYSMSQDAVIGIKKNEGESLADIHLSSDLIDVDGENIYCSYLNDNDSNYRFDLSIGYQDAKGDFHLIGSTFFTTSFEVRNFIPKQKVPVDVTGMADGTYTVVPISRVSETEKWLPNLNPLLQNVQLVVAGGKVKSMTLQTPVVNLKAHSFSFPSKHRVGINQKVNVTFQNLGDEFYGNIYLFVSQDETKGSPIGSVGVTVLKGGETTTTLYFTPDAIGTYNLWLTLDEEGSQVIGQSTVSILERGETGENLEILELAFDVDIEQEQIPGELIQPNWVATKDYRGKLKVKNNGSGEFDGELSIRFFVADEWATNEEGIIPFYTIPREYVFDLYIPAGETVELPFTCENLTEGIYYWPVFSVGNNIVLRQDSKDIRYFLYDAELGIHGVNSQVQADDDAWYTISGQRVSKPTKGLYIHGGKRILVR